MRERECVCYLVLLPTLSGTRRFVDAHNTVDVGMHVVGSIVFFWYGKNIGAYYTVGQISAPTTLFVF